MNCPAAPVGTFGCSDASDLVQQASGMIGLLQHAGLEG